MSKEKVETKPQEETAAPLQRFFFPERCVTIEAVSLEEATKKFEAQYKQ